MGQKSNKKLQLKIIKSFSKAQIIIENKISKFFLTTRDLHAFHAQTHMLKSSWNAQISISSMSSLGNEDTPMIGPHLGLDNGLWCNARWSYEFQPSYQANFVPIKPHLVLANPKPYLILFSTFDCNPITLRLWTTCNEEKKLICIKVQEVLETWLRKSHLTLQIEWAQHWCHSIPWTCSTG